MKYGESAEQRQKHSETCVQDDAGSLSSITMSVRANLQQCQCMAEFKAKILAAEETCTSQRVFPHFPTPGAQNALPCPFLHSPFHWQQKWLEAKYLMVVYALFIALWCRVRLE